MDRDLPEIRRSYEQTIKKLEAKIARLNLRSWPGAARSAHLASFNRMNAVPQTVLSLTLTSGRWLVWHRGYCSLAATGPGAFVNLHSFTPTQLVARTPFFAGWNIGSSNLPFSDFGEVVLEDVSTISLQVYGEGFDTSLWTALSLLAVPQ